MKWIVPLFAAALVLAALMVFRREPVSRDLPAKREAPAAGTPHGPPSPSDQRQDRILALWALTPHRTARCSCDPCRQARANLKQTVQLRLPEDWEAIRGMILDQTVDLELRAALLEAVGAWRTEEGQRLLRSIVVDRSMPPNMRMAAITGLFGADPMKSLSPGQGIGVEDLPWVLAIIRDSGDHRQVRAFLIYHLGTAAQRTEVREVLVEIIRNFPSEPAAPVWYALGALRSTGQLPRELEGTLLDLVAAYVQQGGTGDYMDYKACVSEVLADFAAWFSDPRAVRAMTDCLRDEEYVIRKGAISGLKALYAENPTIPKEWVRNGEVLALLTPLLMESGHRIPELACSAIVSIFLDGGDTLADQARGAVCHYLRWAQQADRDIADLVLELGERHPDLLKQSGIDPERYRRPSRLKR